MTATLIGGPTTLPGTGISAITFGGVTPRSMMVRVSGAAFGTTLTTPLSRMTLLSFAETAHWADAPGGSANPIRRSSGSEVRSARRRVMDTSSGEDVTTMTAGPLPCRRTRAESYHATHLRRPR